MIHKYWLVRQVDLYTLDLIKGFQDLKTARAYLQDKKKNYKGAYTIIKYTETNF